MNRRIDVKNTEKVVDDILKSIILKKERGKIEPNARLREDLGIDSIKMIAMAAQLKEDGIDVISGSKNYDFATIETVQDVINMVDELRK